MRSITSDPIPNQLIGQTCPATFVEGKKYIRLRYCPQELVMINIDTSNKLNLDILNKEGEINSREDKEPFGL